MQLATRSNDERLRTCARSLGLARFMQLGARGLEFPNARVSRAVPPPQPISLFLLFCSRCWLAPRFGSGMLVFGKASVVLAGIGLEAFRRDGAHPVRALGRVAGLPPFTHGANFSSTSRAISRCSRRPSTLHRSSAGSRGYDARVRLRNTRKPAAGRLHLRQRSFRCAQQHARAREADGVRQAQSPVHLIWAGSILIVGYSAVRLISPD